MAVSEHPGITRPAHAARPTIRQTLRRLRLVLPAAGAVTFFVKRLDGHVPSMDGHPRVREATLADLAWLRRGADPTQDPADLAARFRRGDRCIVGTDGEGRAIHVRWLTTRRAFIPELTREVVPGEGEAYFYNGYTRPDARGQGIDGDVRRFIFDLMAREGRTRVWSYVRGDNPAGRRAAARWQEAAAHVRYLRIFGRHVVLLGRGGAAAPRLERPGVHGPARGPSSAADAATWRAWFESWLDKPLAERSTGWSALPDEYFAATADFIAGTLQLDAARDLVLDVGCDSAMVSRLVATRCRRLVGVDFVPGMLADGRRISESGPARGRTAFLAADGRRLPFADARFPKVVCSAMVHTLPTRDDGMAVIHELIRVCAPGGRVLVAGVPDVDKRWAARRDVWKRAGLAGKLALPIWFVLPAAVRRLVKRWLGRTDGPDLYLEYDLRHLRRTLEAAGLRCDVLDYPRDYCSADFRATRSNLLVRIPAGGAAAAGDPDRGDR